MPFRLDTGTLRSPTKQPNGWLRVDGHLTRVGVFTYRNPDGTQRREYRPEEEVMRDDSLASFQMVPVTNDHPPVGLLDAHSAKEFAVGSVGESVRRDGEHVAASMMVTDAEAIEDILGGKSELSCGYSCDLEWKSGDFKGQRYDAVQRNIRGNHVAIVSRGRAGDARLRLDQADAVMTGVAMTDTKEPTMKMKIKGVEVEVPDTAAALVEGERADAAAALANEKRRADTAEAQRDEHKTRADSAERARTDAAGAFAGQVNARVALLVNARRVLGETIKLDELTDRQVREKMLDKLGVKLDALKDRSDDYVLARCDAALEREGKSNSGLAEVRRAAIRADEFGKPKPGEDDDEDDDKEDKAKEKARKDSADAWKAKTPGNRAG